MIPVLRYLPLSTDVTKAEQQHALYICRWADKAVTFDRFALKKTKQQQQQQQNKIKPKT